MEDPVSDQYLSALLEFSQDVVTVVDEAGEISFVSPAVRGALGFEPEELVGENAFDFVHPADREAVVERFSRVIEADERTTDRITYRQRHKDGSWIWVESIGSNRTDTALNGYVINTREITERKQHEQALEEYKEYTEAIFDSFEDGFFVIDTNANVIRWSRAVEEDTGYTAAEVEKMTATDFVPADQAERISENLATVMETGRARFEADLVATDGSRIPYEFIASLLENPDGEPVIAGLGRDVTDRKRRIEQLKHYERAIEGSHDLIAAIDTEYRFLFANQRYREVHAVDRDSITEMTLDEVVGDQIWERIRPMVDRVLDGETVQYQMPRQTPDHNERDLAIRYFPLEDPETGAVSGAVATMRDITDLEENHQQLLVMDRILRHNLRNTMNLVRGLAETIQDDQAGDVVGKAQQIIDESDVLMTMVEKERAITNLLVERPEPRPVVLNERIQQTVESVRNRHPKADISVDLPAAVSAIAIDALDRGIEELLTNAIVHSDQPVPEADLTVTEVGDEVHIRVADNGPTIPEMERNVLTGAGEVDPLYHGSGLGLWLVYWIVRRSGGTLEFDQNEPRGNEISIRLRRPSDAEAETDAA